MKSRLLLLVAATWRTLSRAFIDFPSLAEIRTKAEQGGAEAQYDLGLMYHDGDGVPKDYAEAVKWYRKAAEQGDTLAQTNLGLMYHDGEGVSKDYTEAVKWYRKAAEQGDALAQSNLGVAYAKGEGVPQNYVESYRWFSLAAAQGHEKAKAILNSIKTSMTPDQITEAQKRIAAWRPTPSKQ